MGLYTNSRGSQINSNNFVDIAEICVIIRNMDLREARLKANRMTQFQLFLKTGIDTPRISRIENNLIVPTEKEIKAIARTLKPHKIEYSLCK